MIAEKNFIEQRLPFELQYSKITPKGFPCIYKEWQNDPLTGNKDWSNNDIVRFNFMNSKRGTFDPYRNYLEITVSVDLNEMPVGLLQVDNSAQSFISQMVIYSNNREIERVTEYSTLLSYLNDIGLTEFLTEGREVEGLGYGNLDSSPFNKGVNSANAQPRREHNGGDLSMTYSSGNLFPTIGNGYPEQVQYIHQNSIYNCSRSSKGHVTNSNPILTGSDWNGGDGQYKDKEAITACIGMSGFAHNMRSEYLTSFVTPKYPESSQSIPNYELLLAESVSGGKFPFKFEKGKSYNVYVRPEITEELYYDQSHNKNTHSITTSNFGYSSLFSPLFARGTFEPFISPTVPQCMLQNGQIQKTKFPIFRRKFKVPIASSTIGCFVDSSSFKLLPLESINECLIEFTLDPYAMFTSGYNDICEFDDTGMMLQQKRCFHIDKIQMKIHTYFFIDPEIEMMMKTALYEEITIVSNFWSLGNLYQISANQPPNNSYIVGCNSTNLNEIVCLFEANDYLQYSFCRKHYRLSNNIRRFWSKLAVDYWPPQPFKGNGGNAVSNNLEDDNSIFIENIYWANNYMFGKNPLPRINIYNFALNERVFNPTNRNTFYDPEMYKNQNYSFNSKSINTDTAMGMPWIHENRAVGKAAYIINYTPFVSQEGLLQGVNVSGLSNFEVVFETDATNPFSRDQTLYIFCKSSVVVKYTSEGIKTYGR